LIKQQQIGVAKGHAVTGANALPVRCWQARNGDANAFRLGLHFDLQLHDAVLVGIVSSRGGWLDSHAVRCFFLSFLLLITLAWSVAAAAARMAGAHALCVRSKLRRSP
jgi:hypothetical protein